MKPNCKSVCFYFLKTTTKLQNLKIERDLIVLFRIFANKLHLTQIENDT